MATRDDVRQQMQDDSIDFLLVQFIPDPWYGCSSVFGVHGNPYQFRAGPCQFFHLLDSSCDIRRIGIGHRLDHDRGSTSDFYVSDFYRGTAVLMQTIV